MTRARRVGNGYSLQKEDDEEATVSTPVCDEINLFQPTTYGTELDDKLLT